MGRLRAKGTITRLFVGIRLRALRGGRWNPLVGLLLLLTAGLGTRDAAANVIFVTSLDQKISSVADLEDEFSGCSLQEAISAANFDDNIAIQSYRSDNTPVFVRTACVPGSGNDVIGNVTEV